MARPTPQAADSPGRAGRDEAGNRSRGEDARQRILEAAIEEFAGHGYRGASTRTITARAGVNLGALTYYFGGKPKLYRAVLDHIAGRVEAAVRPICDTATEVLQDPAATTASLRSGLLNLLDGFLDLFMGRTAFEWQSNWAVLMSRAEFEPPDGDPWAFRSVSDAILDPCTELVARTLGRPGTDAECRLMTIAIFGQIIAFRTLFGGQLPAMQWDRIDDARRDAIRRVIHDGVVALLDAKAPRDTP